PGPAVPTPDGITTLQRYVLAIGTTAGVLAMTVALWPSLRRIGFRFRFTPHLRHPAVRRIARLAGWSLVYVAVNQVGLLVTVVLAGTERGAYTAYALAFIFFQLPYAIFAVSVMTALLPRMSESWVERDRGEFGADLAQGIRATAFVVLPAAAGYVAVSQPIVRLLLQHGVTTPRSTELVARVLVAFSVGLFPFAAFQLLLRAFYAMQDTRTPALVNVGAEAVHLAANLTLFLGLGLGVQGLALGHAAGYVFAALVAAVLLARRVGGLRARSLLAGLWKIALASALTGLAAWLAARGIGTWLGTGSLVAQLAQVAGAVLAGLIIFATVSIALRVEEFGLVKRFVLARLGR
ncbi:MAG TPA: lipid II flippase MurJ, partial [Actinomycetota bacterium]|nr:lipid II flippase MurJ [Actinomycetota bacterium]